MEPDFGIGIGTDRTGRGVQRPRPSIFVRLLEMAGLGLVAYGLGSYRFGLAVVGGGMIIGCYTLYRRKHGPAQTTGSESGPDGMDADGGGD
jgi:hypothetical protein